MAQYCKVEVTTTISDKPTYVNPNHYLVWTAVEESTTAGSTIYRRIYPGEAETITLNEELSGDITVLLILNASTTTAIEAVWKDTDGNGGTQYIPAEGLLLVPEVDGAEAITVTTPADGYVDTFMFAESA